MQRQYFHTRSNQDDPNSQYNYKRFGQQPLQHFPKQPYKQYSTPNNHQNEEHWCETCDRSFHSLELLDQHKKQHQKCKIDGCQFIAHPKVITKHIQMQHSSGLFKKIAKLNNPEEIQKWRDERKRRYPTKVNIEKKAAEMKEKIGRGEKMGLHKGGHNKLQKRGDAAQKNHSFRNERNQQQRRGQQTKPNSINFNRKKTNLLPKKTLEVPTTDSLRKLKPFTGIQDILMEESYTEVNSDNTNSEFIIEDDEGEDLPKLVQKEELIDSEPRVCGALSSLISNYDFSDDEIADKPFNDLTKQTAPKIEMNIESNKPIIINNSDIVKANDASVEKNNYCNKSDDDSGPDETKIEKKDQVSEELPRSEAQNKPKKKVGNFENKRKNNNNFKRPKHMTPSTLLQKLLRREVQQERNIILQCIRHIAKNNFFDKSKQ